MDSVPVYFVNGFKFHTSTYGSHRSTYNSGVCVKGSNYSDYSNDFYGILDEILILEYPRLPIKRTVLFKCSWFDPTPNVGMRKHPSCNLVEVNKRRKFSKYEPFIMAMQAEQVYYAPFPSKRRESEWLAVCAIKAKTFVEVQSEEEQEINEDDEAFQHEEGNTHILGDVVADVTPCLLINDTNDFVYLDNDEEKSSSSCGVQSSEDEGDEDEEDSEDDDY